MIALRHKVSVYVARKEHVQTVAHALSSRFGGATATPAEGFWIMQSGSLVTDATTLVYTFTSEPIDPNVLRPILGHIFETSEEEAVAVECDGILYIYNRSDMGIKEAI